MSDFKRYFEDDENIIEQELCVKMSLWYFISLCKTKYQEKSTPKGYIKFFGETGKFYMSTVGNNYSSYSTPGKWKEVFVIDDLEYNPNP